MRDLVGESVSCSGHAARDGLAEDKQVRLQMLGAGVAAWACADGVSLIEDQQRAVLPCHLAQCLVISRLRQHDTHVRHHRLGQHASHVSVAQRAFECVRVVELDHASRDWRIHRRPDVAAPRLSRAVLQRDEGLIDGSVVAPVEDQDLGPPRDLAGQPDGEAVGIGGGERELPVRKPKALLQFFAYHNGVLAGQHQGHAAPRLLFDGRHRRRGRVARHRARIPQAQIDVAVPIDVEELRAARFAHKGRERARPLHHPVHGNTAQQRSAGALEQGRRLRSLRDETSLLALHKQLQAIAIDLPHGPPRDEEIPSKSMKVYASGPHARKTAAGRVKKVSQGWWCWRAPGEHHGSSACLPSMLPAH